MAVIAPEAATAFPVTERTTPHCQRLVSSAIGSLANAQPCNAPASHIQRFREGWRYLCGDCTGKIQHSLITTHPNIYPLESV